ncbi:MAG: 23S rRNA (uracil(1939)-C(5))-methyltransferase RlmD [Bacteroidetes bacterium]|nr:23S rRNA (uracil(1939)-C(5))-methyltransferase RlmD [Bacteroidota bacterium]
MKKNENIIELKVESIGFEGISIAKHDGKVYFVKGGLPGDVVVANANKKLKGYIEATIKEIIAPSPHRIEPICNYYGACGGCSWQCLDYEQQLYWKRQHTIDAHNRLGKVSANCYHNTIAAKQKWEYRNKMDFSFSASRWLTKNEIEKDEIHNKNFALGLHIPGKFDKVLDVKDCKIQDADWNNILDAIREKAIKLDVQPIKLSKAGGGFLKGFTLRKSVLMNENMCILITSDVVSDSEKIFINWYKKELQKMFPNLLSVVWAINNKNGVNIGEIQFIEGKKYLTERVLGIDYQISPFSFFQTNSYQLDTFIGLIIDIASINNSDLIWDLYCGTGSITLPVAKKCKKVFGIELNPQAIEDAKNNANINAISNVEFYSSDLHSPKIPDLLNTLPCPDVLILDPPRSGLHPNLIKHILQILPPKIVYVSCNPATQARDLSELTKHYNLLNVHLIDMFPHTYHIENVAELVLK